MQLDLDKYVCGITGHPCSGCSWCCEHRKEKKGGDSIGPVISVPNSLNPISNKKDEKQGGKIYDC